jgi:hypothetical protein
VFQAALHWLMRSLNATGAGLWFVITGAWGDGTMGTWVYILAVGFVVALVAVPAAFKGLRLAQATEAMGLPDGSVRAIIALSLVFLFAVVPIYLFDRVAGHGGMATIAGISEQDKPSVGTKYAASDPIFVKVSPDPLHPEKDTYTMFFREPDDQTATDFAKQMLVLLGTLATSVASFYFGSNTATTAATAATTAATNVAAASRGGRPARPVITGLTTESGPPQVRPAAGPVTFTLNLQGANLNDVKTVRMQSGNEIFSFTATATPAQVHSNDKEVTCSVSCTPTVAAPSPWDVVVEDSAGQVSDPLTGQLSF